VLETIERSPAGKWLLGYDTHLLRKVWIDLVPAGTPSVPPGLRQIGRVGRLRWIAGRRLEQENWDAFESVSGKALLRLVSERQSWEQVRFWLLDLAKELELAEKDGTRPSELALDRVWITANGRAKLLDFPAPGLRDSSGAALRTLGESGTVTLGAPAEADAARNPPVLGSSPAVAQFLSQVAKAALQGESQPGANERPTVPLPLPAREFLSRLPELTGTASILTTLQPLVHQIPTVSRRRRLGLVAGCTAFPLFAAAGFLFAVSMFEQSERQQPGLWDLSQLLYAHSGQSLPWVRHRTGPDDRSYALYIASHYRPLITDSNQWRSMYSLSLIQGANRRFAEQSIAQYPNPTEEEVPEATSTIEPILASLNSANPIKQPSFPGLAFGFTLMIYVAVPALLAGLLFRGGLILRGLRVAVVRRDGTPASRLRFCWRGLVSWAPVLLWPVGLACLKPMLGVTWAAVLLIGLVAGLVLWSVLLPKRSLQDRLAGTFLVPR
jgi:eukaryotic-like serine/threonine-protein kinase